MSFSSVKIVGSQAMPDRVYYNATVINNTISTSQASDDPPIRFADTRQTPLIADSSKYNVSVQNFELNGATKSLPILIPQIIPSNTITIIGAESNGAYARYYFNSSVVPYFNAGDIATSVEGLTGTLAPLNFTTPKAITSITVGYGPGSYSFQVSYTGAVIVNISGMNGVATFNVRNPADVNGTAYFLSVNVFDGTNYCAGDAQVIWEPENVTPFTIIPISATPQVETDYYYCYNYSHWVYLLNRALVTAWTNATNISASKGGSFGTQCPFFEFDPSTGLFSLNQDANTSMCPVGTALPVPFSTTFTATGAYTNGEYSFVGMNSNLEGLMTNFTSIYYAVGPEWRQSGINLPEVVIDMGLTNLSTNYNSPPPVTGANCINVLKGQVPSTFFLTNPFTNNETSKAFVRLTQDFVSTGSLWSPITSFVLVTTQIPVRNEALANPVTLGTANIGTQNSSSGSFQRVLLETPINAVTADIWRGWVLYQPLTPTLSSLEESKEGIVELDLYLYWRNRLTNSLVPVRLYNTGTMSFRLLFEKRSV